MNRSFYFNYIEEKLSVLAYRIETRGKINLLELNIHSESFFADLLNVVYGLSFKNLNPISHNFEGIDLIDEDNKIVGQVSSTCTKQKIENSLSKKMLEKFKDYKFKFISIAKDAENQRQNTFTNPYSLAFEPSVDIIDIVAIIESVLYLLVDEQKMVFELVRSELGNDIQEISIASNLATIVDILARDNLSVVPNSPTINTHKIEEKIIFNDLAEVRALINEYKVFYSKLDEIYSEFDKQGINKSISVLRRIHSQYVKLSSTSKSPRSLFYAIIAAISTDIVNSVNHIEIPIEELEMCTNILVVDAFVRCKIFENPEGYNHVITR